MRHFSFENVCQNICWLHSGVLGRHMAALPLSLSRSLSGLSGTPRTSILIIFCAFLTRVLHFTRHRVLRRLRVGFGLVQRQRLRLCRLGGFSARLGFPAAQSTSLSRTLSLSFSLSPSLAVKHKHLSQTIKQLATIFNVFEVTAETEIAAKKRRKTKNEGRRKEEKRKTCSLSLQISAENSAREKETKMPPQSLIVPIAQ